jgi:hypothetical protein
MFLYVGRPKRVLREATAGIVTARVALMMGDLESVVR